jgi:hypothetical protein
VARGRRGAQRELAQPDLARQVAVETGETAYGERTVIRIDHRIPDVATARRARWRITTHAQALPREKFDERGRARIGSASAERGRRLYCIDLDSEEVMAALAYHLDDRPGRPLLLTAIAFRIDTDESPELRLQSRVCLGLLKQYVHAISARIGRGGFVDVDAPDRADVLRALGLLGFRPAPHVKHFEPGGVHMRQAAPGR